MTDQERDAARALVEQWRAYVQHKPTCWLNYETRDLVPSESGREVGCGMRFRREGDAEPTCTCGLSALLAQAGGPPPKTPNWQHAEMVERIIKRVEAGGKWEPQPESAGHLRRWLIDNLRTVALALRKPEP